MPSQGGHFNTNLWYPTLFNLLPQRLTHTITLQRWVCKNKEDRKCTYNVKIERVRVTIDAVEEKQVLNITCLCILAVVIRHANSILSASYYLSHVTCLALLYFFTLSKNVANFGGKKKLLNIKHVFWFSLQLFSDTFLIVRIIQRDNTISVHRSSSKVPVIVVRF